jgi:hypothetical protein
MGDQKVSKGVSRIHKSKKDRQHTFDNGQKEKDGRKKKTMVKTILHTELKIEENEPGVNSSVPGRMISFWFNSDTRRATLVKNPLGL